MSVYVDCFVFFKQKTAYEMRISDWSSDVCSSDLMTDAEAARGTREAAVGDERHRLAQALAVDGGGRGQHLAHAGAALRPLVADDDHEIGRASCRERVCQYV